MTKIEHYRNSFISVISNDNKVLWCDPWLSDANGGLWASSEISIETFLSTYDLPNLIYISHLHDDHFDIEFLKLTFKKKEFEIIIPKGDKSYETMYRRLISSGIPSENILRVSFFEKTNIDKFNLFVLPQYNQSTSKENSLSLIDYDIDSSLLINIDSIQIFNQNDNFYNSENIQCIRKKLYHQNVEFNPNLSFIPYCAASCYPQSFLNLDRLALRKDLLKRIFNDCFLDPAKSINSGIYIPSGGTYSFCSDYDFIDNFKAVPSQSELYKLVNGQDQVSKDSIFIGDQIINKNYQLTMKNLESDISKKNMNMQSKVPLSTENYKRSFIQASKKLDKFLDKFPLTLEIALISYEQLGKSLKSGSSNDISKYELLYKNIATNSQNKLKIFLTPFCLIKLINESISWNAINFGAVFIREPNIYYPTADMFLSLFFKVTSNCFLSESQNKINV